MQSSIKTQPDATGGSPFSTRQTLTPYQGCMQHTTQICPTTPITCIFGTAPATPPRPVFGAELSTIVPVLQDTYPPSHKKQKIMLLFCNAHGIKTGACFRYAPVSVHDRHAEARDASPDQRRPAEHTDVGRAAVEALHQRQGILAPLQDSHLRGNRAQIFAVLHHLHHLAHVLQPVARFRIGSVRDKSARKAKGSQRR